MYQIRINICNEYLHWIYAIESNLKKSLKDLAVMVSRIGEKRSYYAFACENKNKQEVMCTIKESLNDMLSKEAKWSFFDDAIVVPSLSCAERNLLISALVEFDRESEKEIINKAYALSDGLCVDGVYNFLLKELKARWKEVLGLLKENSIFLVDKEVFYELIKFLFSAIKPKVNKISIDFDGKAYLLKAFEGKRLRVAYTDEQLMCALIEYAPIEIYFEQHFSKNSVMRNISKLFNIKSGSVGNILK